MQQEPNSSVAAHGASSEVRAAESRGAYPWREALAWMLLLGLLFIVGYSVTNRWAATRPHAFSLHGAWDDWIPFLPWTIWPYLSLNAIFPVTFFAFDDVRSLRRHAMRIAAVQLACFALFSMFPSVNVRPLQHPGGVSGMLFAQLHAFERPFNMFPSLHAAVLLLVWRAWLPRMHDRSGRARPGVRMLWDGWCLLILLSTLTTWQHDLIDIAAGLGLGLLALAIWPMGPGGQRPAGDMRR
ncbi:phosphatase PAP2 family protein [Candidimonas humi]|uniref:Phosphatase PAP2 family protein n=1 Tax=Candidimonas humi TaxID=683355 RepID=A0ABV8NW79_9BURK|nr:phosphatase PAP2 family protein [Candidimonas humi]MBV6304992.1 phosphatase PAP2 family protein [Candidimonas humi]